MVLPRASSWSGACSQIGACGPSHPSSSRASKGRTHRLQSDRRYIRGHSLCQVNPSANKNEVFLRDSIIHDDPLSRDLIAYAAHRLASCARTPSQQFGRAQPQQQKSAVLRPQFDHSSGSGNPPLAVRVRWQEGTHVHSVQGSGRSEQGW